MMLLYRIRGLRKLTLILENFIFWLQYRKTFKNRIKIYGFPIINIESGSNISIGKNIVFISNTFFSEPGISHPVIIRLLNKDSILSIGDNVGISGCGICVQNKISIGNNVLMGANVFIADTDFHPTEPQNRRFSRTNVRAEEVIIEDNVFIGMNSTILKGVRIGKNSIIGAHSLVTRNIPANVIAAGNPCKVLRHI